MQSEMVNSDLVTSVPSVGLRTEVETTSGINDAYPFVNTKTVVQTQNNEKLGPKDILWKDSGFPNFSFLASTPTGNQCHLSQ